MALPGRTTCQAALLHTFSQSLSFPKERSGEERDFIFSYPFLQLFGATQRAREQRKSCKAGISKVNCCHVPLTYSYYIIKLYSYYFMFLLIPCGSQFSTLYIHFETARFSQTSVSPLSVSLLFAVSTQTDLKAGPALSTEQRAEGGSNPTLPGESNAFAVQEIGPSSQIITS